MSWYVYWVCNLDWLFEIVYLDIAIFSFRLRGRHTLTNPWWETSRAYTLSKIIYIWITLFSGSRIWTSNGPSCNSPNNAYLLESYVWVLIWYDTSYKGCLLVIQVTVWNSNNPVYSHTSAHLANCWIIVFGKLLKLWESSHPCLNGCLGGA